MKNLLIIAIILFTCEMIAWSQNLITNPGAEGGDPTATGWVQVGGAAANCFTGTGWRITHNQNGFPAANGGSHYFYCGCTSANRELRLDIDVNGRSATIDGGAQSFTFAGFTRVFSQNPRDQARIIVEYRNAANNAVLGSYDTGLQSSTAVWTSNSDTRNAPIGTRFVRIRLLSISNNGASVDAYFDDLSLTTPVNLPVELANFTITNVINNALLTWETKSERDNDYFVIEQSNDGLNWNFLTNIAGNGTSSSSNYYDYLDVSNINSISYYRLSQVDYNGEKTIFEIKKFKKESESFNLYPMPVSQSLTIEGEDLEKQKIRIFNSQGQEVFIESSYSDGKLISDFSNIKNGHYFLNIENEKSIITKKFIVAH